MRDDIQKRIVLLKDVPSNIIEEAIIILKGEHTLADCKCGSKVPSKAIFNDKNYLLKEAELIVNQYINMDKVKQPASDKKARKLSGVQKKFMTNTIINLVLIGSIALFIFMVSKLL